MDLEQIAAPASQVEAFLEAFLDQREMPGNLREAIRYSLLGPGKRMRPVLVIRCAEAVGGDVEAAIPPAAAIEMIHCFSLIHDDLPAMDDDDLRRGRPTLHKQTNEAMAILAGDSLTTLAFELLATRAEADRAHRLITELATAAHDMINGQVHDTLPAFADEVSDADRLAIIHRNKTGALIRGACRLGAVSAHAIEPVLEGVTRYGEAIGMMFQVVDDIIDGTQTTEHLGKTANKDAEQGKLTFPSVHGLERSREIVDQLRQQALDALEPFGPNAAPLRDLCEYMATRTR